MAKHMERKVRQLKIELIHDKSARSQKQNLQQIGHSVKFPTYREMVTTALGNVNRPYGLGLETILTFILRKYKIHDKTNARRYLKSSLTKGINTGYFKIFKAASGVFSYKLSDSKTITKTAHGKASRKESKTRNKFCKVPTNANRKVNHQNMKTEKKAHTVKTTPKSLAKAGNPDTSTSKTVRTTRKRKSLMKPLPLQRISSASRAETSNKERYMCDALSNISMERVEPVLVKAPGDVVDCYIAGVDVTEDGRIIVADFSNRNVKVFSMDGTWLMSRSLSARPSGYNTVAAINNDEALLNIWSEGTLHILDLKTKLLATKETVPIPYSLLSVCCYQDQFFATSGVGVPSLIKLDRKGTVYWSRKLDDAGQCLFKSPCFSTCFQDGDMLTVLIADDAKGTISSIDGASGALLKVLSSENKQSVGPIAYGRGHLFIWNPEGKEIDVWTTDLANKTTVISDLCHGVSGCMKYCESRNCLMVTYGWFTPSPNAIDCYTLTDEQQRIIL